LTWVAGLHKTPRWFNCRQRVTHPSTNQTHARAITSI